MEFIEAAGTPVLAETTEGGGGASAWCWKPAAIVDRTGCAPETTDDPGIATGEGFESVATGVTGTGLKATPANVEVVEEPTETVATDVSTETATTSGAWEHTLVSDWVPWLADFSACSRANWKQASQN